MCLLDVLECLGKVIKDMERIRVMVDEHAYIVLS